MSFLRGEWRRLALVNYVVDPEVLRHYIPARTEIDLWNGKCYLSLVGFMFKNTRLLGIKVPWHVDFEEVNLRFYVTHDTGEEVKRGVVFIKEIVPKPALTLVANTVYQEHYQTLPMRHVWAEEDVHLKTQYSWKTSAGWNHLTLFTEKAPVAIQEDSEVEFITEHYWGYTRLDAQTTYEYQVTHPKWRHFPVHDMELKVNYRDSYGDDFAFLNDLQPSSVMLAAGSPITVEQRRRIR